MAINPKQLGQQIVSNIPTRKTLRDLDDFQSYMFPDMTSQEFVDALKGGKKYEDIFPDYKYRLDTAARELFDRVVPAETNMSPREYQALVNKAGSPLQWRDEYMEDWDEWNKGGRKSQPMDSERIETFISDYFPNGTESLYRPQEYWGKSKQIYSDYVNEQHKDKYKKALNEQGMKDFIKELYGDEIFNKMYGGK